MNDIKYIGLDVHQATISAAVLDSTGKLLMESVVETRASTILQFIHGLRGSVQVTFEEGTCAAWLHDLLQPHVANVLVCDPRKNALLKSGNKNDRIDARKLADLFRSGLLCPVYHKKNGVGALKELARSYLTLNRDVTRVMNRLKAIYRGWAVPCAGQRVYAPRYRSGVSRPDHRSRRTSPGRDLLPTTGRVAVLAPAGTTGSAGREWKTWCGEIAAPDSFDWIDSRGTADCPDTDASSFSHQAATMGLQWLGFENLRQRRVPLRGRPVETIQEVPGHPRTQRQPQSRSEKHLQRGGHPSHCRPRTVPGVLRRAGSRRDEADDGASHPGTQDRGHHFDRLEERSPFRRPISEATSSLSVCGKSFLDSSG